MAKQSKTLADIQLKTISKVGLVTLGILLVFAIAYLIIYLSLAAHVNNQIKIENTAYNQCQSAVTKAENDYIESAQTIDGITVHSTKAIDEVRNAGSCQTPYKEFGHGFLGFPKIVINTFQ